MNVRSERKGPVFTAVGFLPAFSQVSLGNIIVIDHNQAFINLIIDSDDIPLERLEGTNGNGFGALDTDIDT